MRYGPWVGQLTCTIDLVFLYVLGSETTKLSASFVSALDKLTKHVDDQFLRIEAKARELTRRRMDEIIAIELDNRINAAKAGKSFLSSDQ